MTDRRLRKLRDLPMTNKIDLRTLFSDDGKHFDMVNDDDDDLNHLLVNRKELKITKRRRQVEADASSDDELVLGRVRKRTAKKQSQIFRSPMIRWFPGDGDGDPDDRDTWRYVHDWEHSSAGTSTGMEASGAGTSADLEGSSPIRNVPKYTVLSNLAAWKAWKSGAFSASDMAKYWPLDFASRQGRAVLADARRPRGKSKIFNCEWAKLPVYGSNMQVELKEVPPNDQWGKAGYDYNQGVQYVPVWPTATSITMLSHEAPIFNPFAATLLGPDQALALEKTTPTLPDMDDDTLFLTWCAHPMPHPELRIAFAANERIHHEMGRLGPVQENEILYCRNVGSDFGAVDVMIAPRPRSLRLSPALIRQRFAKAIQLALMACMSRRKKKLIVGGLFAGGIAVHPSLGLQALPISVPWYGGEGACPYEVTVYRKQR
ncbi:hypothetical protein IWX90DRAFT_434715 [Phyllosticta citrichinensis]|uniref:Uncharacterized protein n=1 Tax=Phyllosticta citrichinensis TaxID=1130410 RepID=A0ABR1XUZ9_9PEZI